MKSQSVPIFIKQKITKVNGEVSSKVYRRKRMLGKGGFAECYEVVDCETQKTFAVKTISKMKILKTKTRSKLFTQIKIHRSLHHPNIVQFFNVFQDDDFIYIFLELCPFKGLNQIIKARKRLTAYEVRFYLANIVKAFIYLHQNNIIHRDLKSGNVFLGEGLVPKVGDFGLAAKLQFDGQKKRTVCGTPNYIAPDVLEQIGYSFQVDIWSIGVFTYSLLYGHPPFQNADVNMTYQQIKKGKFSFPDDSNVPHNAKDLITKILVVNPKFRITLQQILEHAFISKTELPLSLPQDAVQKVPHPKKQEKRKIVIDKGFMTTREINGHMTPRRGLDSPRESVLRFQKLQKQIQLKRQKSNEIFVYKWLDYQKKYGIGFQLSNGVFGVYFIDNTVLVLDQKLNEITQIIRKKEQIKKRYQLDKFPTTKDYQKKYKLLLSFKEELQTKAAPSRKSRIQDGIRRDVYIKQYIKLKDAFLFRLSNGLINVFFQTGSQLIYQFQLKRVRFWNDSGQYETCPVSEIDDESSDLFDAMSYTKWVFKQLAAKNLE